MHLFAILLVLFQSFWAAATLVKTCDGSLKFPPVMELERLDAPLLLPRIEGGFEPNLVVTHTQVFYQDFAAIWSSRPILTDEEQASVRARVIEDLDGSNARSITASSARELGDMLGPSAAHRLISKIDEVLGSIRRTGKDSAPLEVMSVSFHIEGARKADYLHRHDWGEIILALSEAGRITKIHGLEASGREGAEAALFTDGVLHIPDQSSSLRLIIFVALSTPQDALFKKSGYDYVPGAWNPGPSHDP